MSSETVHLLVLIHGMWGKPDHLAEMHRIFDETYCQSDSKIGQGGERLHILVAQTNRESSTYDGIDWGGERVAEEVTDEVKKLAEESKTVTRFSVTGYSLGGLIARYVVGILHQRGFFETILPINFNTVATPHIGLIRYPTFRSTLFATLGPKLLSRTGEQFYTVDKWSARGRPLLEVMADPERIFYQALSLFTNICLYANAVNDLTVPYMTSAIELEDPFQDHAFNGIEVQLDEKYSPVIKSYTIPSTLNGPPPKPIMLSPLWFKTFKLPLPPALDFRFPFNIFLIASLPVVLPAILSLVLVRLTLDSRSSRCRIKLLEADESYPDRLIHVVGQLEKSMEDAVAEIIDDPGEILESPQTELLTPEDSLAFQRILDEGVEDVGKATGNEASESRELSASRSSIPLPRSSSTTSLNAPTERSNCYTKIFKKKANDDARSDGLNQKAQEGNTGQSNTTEKPLLSDLQKRLVASMNQIPGLKKQLVFIDPVMNSHAVIVSRDVKRFKHHSVGEGVLRHLADHFVL